MGKSIHNEPVKELKEQLNESGQI